LGKRKGGKRIRERMITEIQTADDVEEAEDGQSDITA
jgi:hypothetical protein